MRTVFDGCTLGDVPPIRASSGGSLPRSAASGMPCTFPLWLVAGVFMSPCASIQISPIGCSRVFLAHSADAATEPGAEAVIAAEHDRHGALEQRLERRLIQLLADLGDLPDVLLALVSRLLRFGDRRGEVALVDDRAAEARDLLAEPGDPKRRGSHVHAAAVAAEIQRDADDVDGLHKVRSLEA